MNRAKTLSVVFKRLNFQVTRESNSSSLLAALKTVNVSQQCQCSQVTNTSKKKASSVLDPTENLDLSHYGSVLLPSFNLAAYADKSPLLQEFIKLNVELYKIEKKPEAAQYILTLNFEKNVKPLILFLTDNGVPVDKLGEIITKNPYIFKVDMRDLEVRVNYLKSKKFSKEMISQIITKNPNWLSFSVKMIDSKLGFLQQSFNLSGDEVRQMITKVPGLGTLNDKKLKVNMYALKEEMELDDFLLKKLVLATPSVLKRNAYDFVATYEYITKTMKVNKELVLKTPEILSVRRFMLKERHGYLEILGRAQYNPLLPGYVSLSQFLNTDSEFCEQAAKTSVHSYNQYLKTL